MERTAVDRPYAADVDGAPRIVRNPRVLSGEPTIAGTRIPVRSIVISQRRYGDLAHVCAAYRLDLATVEAALAFYETNREEIDREIRDNEPAASG